MNTSETSGVTTSVWMATEDMPSFSPLKENIATEVCIVGGGIAGLTTAYLLASEGVDVTLIDDGPLAGGETSRTTAHLSYVLDDTFTRLESLFGEEKSRLAAQSHAAAVDKIQQIIETHSIECDFARVPGYLFRASNYTAEDLDKEMQAALRAGLEVSKIDRAPFRDFDTGPCLRYENQAQFHVLKYLKRITELIKDKVKIYTYTKAENIKDGDQPYLDVSGGYRIVANHVVVATNTPVNDIVTMHTKQAPYRTYAVGAKIRKGTLEKALYWDTLENYHYIRTQPFDDQHDILIIGGEDNKTGQDDTPTRLNELKKWSTDHFTEVDGFEFEWSGQVMEPVDCLGFLGKNPGDKHTYIITGDSGHGMTHATIGAMIITDLIQNRSNEWASLYDPARITIKSAGSFIKENLNVVGKYTELLSKEDVSTVAEIAPGCGAIVSNAMKKIAVYKDDENNLHAMSAICPHLGCVVNWNDLEKSWDCPCHGSRFTSTGTVISGPAVRDLSPVALPVTLA